MPENTRKDPRTFFEKVIEDAPLPPQFWFFQKTMREERERRVENAAKSQELDRREKAVQKREEAMEKYKAFLDAQTARLDAFDAALAEKERQRASEVKPVSSDEIQSVQPQPSTDVAQVTEQKPVVDADTDGVEASSGCTIS